MIAAAGRIAERHRHARVQPLLHALPIIGALAREAPGAGGVAVQLDHPVRGQAGPLVEVVDVLGDHAVELPEPPQTSPARDAPGWARRGGSPGRWCGPAPSSGGGRPRSAMKFWKVNSLGSKRSQTPPGLRKSGIPDSVLTPAPVKTTMRDDAATSLSDARDRIRSPAPLTLLFRGLAGDFLLCGFSRPSCGRARASRLRPCARVGSFRAPTPPRIRAPVRMAWIHPVRSPASSG